MSMGYAFNYSYDKMPIWRSMEYFDDERSYQGELWNGKQKKNIVVTPFEYIYVTKIINNNQQTKIRYIDPLPDVEKGLNFLISVILKHSFL